MLMKDATEAGLGCEKADLAGILSRGSTWPSGGWGWGVGGLNKVPKIKGQSNDQWKRNTRSQVTYLCPAHFLKDF